MRCTKGKLHHIMRGFLFKEEHMKNIIKSSKPIFLILIHLLYSFYKKTGEIVAIKMIDLEAELLNDEQDTALAAIAQEIQFLLDC